MATLVYNEKYDDNNIHRDYNTKLDTDEIMQLTCLEGQKLFVSFSRSLFGV